MAPLCQRHISFGCVGVAFEFDAFKDLMRNEISSSGDMARSFRFPRI